MKGMKMNNPWRTIQLFISSQAAGIFEVEVDTDTKDVRCSCPVWKKTFKCKHVNFVNAKMRLNNGNYSISVPTDIPEDIATTASTDPKAFRDFVVKHAKIEVL